MESLDSDDEEGLSAPIFEPQVSYADAGQSGLPEMAIQFVGDGSAGSALPPPQQPLQQRQAPAQQQQQQQRQPQVQAIDPALIKSWTIVYPRYLEEGLSTAQGRRLARSKVAGCLNLNVFDLAEGAFALGFPVNCIVLEQGKRHPRAEPWLAPGRLRLRLTTEAGAPVVPAIDTKEKLLCGLGRVVPTLESRRQRNEQHRLRILEVQEAQRKEHAKRTGQQQLQQQPAAGGGGGKR